MVSVYYVGSWTRPDTFSCSMSIFANSSNKYMLSLSNFIPRWYCSSTMRFTSNLRRCGVTGGKPHSTEILSVRDQLIDVCSSSSPCYINNLLITKASTISFGVSALSLWPRLVIHLLSQRLRHRRSALSHEVATHEGPTTLLTTQHALADLRRHAQLHHHLLGHLGTSIC